MSRERADSQTVRGELDTLERPDTGYVDDHPGPAHVCLQLHEEVRATGKHTCVPSVTRENRKGMLDIACPDVFERNHGRHIARTRSVRFDLTQRPEAPVSGDGMVRLARADLVAVDVDQ